MIQLMLNKNNNKVQSSTSFVHKAKEWKIEPTKIQVSYDVINLNPSVLLDKSIRVIIEFLQEDLKQLLINRTKLNLTDIYQLLELYLSEFYFLCNNLFGCWKTRGL